MLQGEYSAILLTFIRLPFVVKVFVLSIFEWRFYTDFTVYGQIVSTQIRLFPQEQSDLDHHCLSKRLREYLADDKSR